MNSGLADLLLTLEQRLLAQEVRSSRERLEQLLAPGFREFGSSGRMYTREWIISSLLSEEPASRSLSDVECRILGDGGAALLTYTAERTTSTGSVRTLRSSLWVNSGTEWRLLFHQGTPHAAG